MAKKKKPKAGGGSAEIRDLTSRERAQERDRKALEASYDPAHDCPKRGPCPTCLAAAVREKAAGRFQTDLDAGLDRLVLDLDRLLHGYPDRHAEIAKAYFIQAGTSIAAWTGIPIRSEIEAAFLRYERHR